MRSSVNRIAMKRDSRNSIDEMNLIRAQLLSRRLLAYSAVSASKHIFKAPAQFLLVQIMTPPIRYALVALRHLPFQHLLAYFPGRRRPRRSMSTYACHPSGGRSWHWLTQRIAQVLLIASLYCQI